MSLWRALSILAVTAVLLLVVRQGRRPSVTRAIAPLAGPEIRVKVLAAPALFCGFPGAVELTSLEDGRVLYRGELPLPCAVRLEGRELEISGRRFPGGLRLAPLGGSPSGLRSDGWGRAFRKSPDPGGQGVAYPAAERSDGAESAAVWQETVAVLRERLLQPFFLVAVAGSSAPPGSYRGALEIRPGEADIEAVNALNLEAYLAGVVASEVPARAALEALKAQAVACRTYALYSLRLAERQGRRGIFSAGPSFQVYRGLETEHPRVLEALEETRGEVLTYLGRLFRSYFHSACGGQTARACLVFDEPDIPPLGGVSCGGGCDSSRRARWSSVLTRSDLDRAVRREVARRHRKLALGRVRGVEVAETGPDGRVRYVRVNHELGSFEWNADRFRRAVEAVKPGRIHSTYFRILTHSAGRTGEDGVVVEGRGWGHGVGLCQFGCMKRGREQGYREVLALYYPKSAIRKAY